MSGQGPPVQVIIVPVEVPTASSSAWSREVKPVWKPNPKRDAWRPRDAIPQVDKAELRRKVQQMPDAHRLQRERLRAAGAAMLERLAA